MYKKLLAIFMVILSFSSFAKNKLKINYVGIHDKWTL